MHQLYHIILVPFCFPGLTWQISFNETAWILQLCLIRHYSNKFFYCQRHIPIRPSKIMQINCTLEIWKAKVPFVFFALKNFHASSYVYLWCNMLIIFMFISFYTIFFFLLLKISFLDSQLLNSELHNGSGDRKSSCLLTTWRGTEITVRGWQRRCTCISSRARTLKKKSSKA